MEALSAIPMASVHIFLKLQRLRIATNNQNLLLGSADIAYIVSLPYRVKSNKNNCPRLGTFLFLLLFQSNSGSKQVSVSPLTKESVTRKIHSGRCVFGDFCHREVHCLISQLHWVSFSRKQDYFYF